LQAVLEGRGKLEPQPSLRIGCLLFRCEGEEEERVCVCVCVRARACAYKREMTQRASKTPVTHSLCHTWARRLMPVRDKRAIREKTSRKAGARALGRKLAEV